ncbi:MAG: hypothetical protein HDQ97_07500 [Lachnospiraceae bacterium]|nr:hypothetical protein [Lachnospiraceae bacterium]
MQDKGKAAFYVIAGGYLLYLAYQLFKSRMDNGGENYALFLTFSILFAIVSAVILIYTALMYRKMLKREAEEEMEPEESGETGADKLLEREEASNEKEEPLEEKQP